MTPDSIAQRWPDADSPQLVDALGVPVRMLLGGVFLGRDSASRLDVAPGFTDTLYAVRGQTNSEQNGTTIRVAYVRARPGGTPHATVIRLSRCDEERHHVPALLLLPVAFAADFLLFPFEVAWAITDRARQPKGLPPGAPAPVCQRVADPATNTGSAR